MNPIQAKRPLEPPPFIEGVSRCETCKKVIQAKIEAIGVMTLDNSSELIQYHHVVCKIDALK